MAATGVAPEEQLARAVTARRAHRSWTPLARALSAAGDRWTLMIVLQLAPGRTRLSHLQSCIPGISTGVLERYIEQMVASGLVRRMRFKEMPPRVELELTEAGADLLPVAGALARWGMRHMWSPPLEGEWTDVGCLLRLLPVLLEGTPTPEGSLEAITTHPGPRGRYAYRTTNGHLHFAEDSDGPPTARIEGSQKAWLEALGTRSVYRRLRITGDERFALSILDAFHGNS